MWKPTGKSGASWRWRCWRCCFLLTLVGATIARYIRQQEQSAVAEPQDFYFTSDLLKEEEQDAVYEIDPQAETLTVVLYNFADIKRITSSSSFLSCIP